MKYYLSILVILLFPCNSFSQLIKGKITNQKGDPVQYATVYIQELKQGTTANSKGDYEIRLPEGKYTIIYQSLGFEPIFVNLVMSDKVITKDIILPLQYYEIPEVRITASGEDPAYIIMRKVIGMAPYYLNNISYYKADVYLKGNLVFNRIPKIMQKSMKIESHEHGTTLSAGDKAKGDEKRIKEGDSFLMESYNEIEFTAPDKYFQKVISYNSTFPSEGENISPMDFIQASFYQPVLADMAISPLSPAAFSHYRFKYLGASLQGNFTINKIEVIPKRKSQQLFEGTIYIIEDLWCLHSVDLVNDNLAGRIKIQQLYIPVQDEIWMPVSHKFEIAISILGFKADAGYSGSVKYLDVKRNLALQKPKTISTNYTGKPLADAVTPDQKESKEKQQIEKILEKDDLNNRDMVKLARLMEKESENSLPDSTKNNLEVVTKTTHVIEKDANKKDSAYWAEIRPVPLSDLEKHSLRVSDSLKAETNLRRSKNDSIPITGAEKKSIFFKSIKQVVTGHTWSDTSGLRFTYGGLINTENFSFNTVDGFIYGFNFNLYKSWRNNSSFRITPDVKWAFSREALMWRVNASYSFYNIRRSQIFSRVGVSGRDIANGGSINTFLNTASSLLLKDNYLKLYESKYLTLGYSSEIINGLTLQLSTNYEDRRVLENTSDFSLIKSSKVYSDNTPVNEYLVPGSDPVNFLRNQRHADFVTKVTYIPYQKYRISNGARIPLGSDWPTFSMTWKHGINEFTEYTGKLRHYDMLRFEVSNNRTIGAFSDFRWIVRAGGFIDNNNVGFIDFFHFNTQPTALLLNDYTDAFMLPSFYSLSTPEAFGEIHIKYTTPYLLINLLPVLSNTLMRENLSFSLLSSRFRDTYSEIGYSISEFLFLGEIGVYAGFENLSYKNIGAKLVLKF